MKKFKVILSIGLIIILALSLAACGKSGGSGGDGPSPVGTYKLTGMTENGEPVSEEDLALLESFGMAITLELRDDNTGTMNMMGEAMEITWDDKNLTVEGDPAPYTFDGTTLTVEDQGNSLVFTLEENTEG